MKTFKAEAAEIRGDVSLSLTAAAVNPSVGQASEGSLFTASVEYTGDRTSVIYEEFSPSKVLHICCINPRSTSEVSDGVGLSQSALSL